MNDSITVNMGLNTSAFGAGLADAEAKTKAFSKSVDGSSSTMDKLTTSIKGTGEQLFNLAKTAGATVLVSGIVMMTKKVIDLSGELLSLSKVTGISTDELQRLDYAASQNGSTAQTMNQALQYLARQVAENNKVFEELGIKTKDSTGKNRELMDVLGDVADALSSVDDPARKLSISTSLLGRAANDLIPILQVGRAEMEAMANGAPVISKENLEALNQFGDDMEGAWDKLTTFAGNMTGQFIRMPELLREAYAETANLIATSLGLLPVIDDAVNGEERKVSAAKQAADEVWRQYEAQQKTAAVAAELADIISGYKFSTLSDYMLNNQLESLKKEFTEKSTSGASSNEIESVRSELRATIAEIKRRERENKQKEDEAKREDQRATQEKLQEVQTKRSREKEFESIKEIEDPEKRSKKFQETLTKFQEEDYYKAQQKVASTGKLEFNPMTFSEALKRGVIDSSELNISNLTVDDTEKILQELKVQRQTLERLLTVK